MVCAVEVAPGLRRKEEVDCGVDSMNVVAVVLGRDIVGWDPTVGTLSLFRLPDLAPGLFPCPFVLGGDSHVRGDPDVVGAEGVAGTFVDWQRR